MLTMFRGEISSKHWKKKKKKKTIEPHLPWSPRPAAPNCPSPTPWNCRASKKKNQRGEQHISSYIYIYPKLGVPQNQWFVRENRIYWGGPEIGLPPISSILDWDFPL